MHERGQPLADQILPANGGFIELPPDLQDERLLRIPRLPRRELEAMIKSPIQTEDLQGAGIISGLHIAAQEELDARNKKSRSKGNFQYLLQGKDVPAKNIIDGDVFSMSGNLLPPKPMAPETTETTETIETPKSVMPNNVVRAAITLASVIPLPRRSSEATTIASVAPDKFATISGKLYEDAPALNAYEAKTKAIEKGKGSLHQGMDYLTNEELQSLIDHESGIRSAAQIQKSLNQARADHDKYVRKNVNHYLRRGSMSQSIGTKAQQARTEIEKQKAALTDRFYNGTEPKLLTRSQLRDLQNELANRQRADAHIQAQFDKLGQTETGTDPELQILQFLGLRGPQNKQMKRTISWGSLPRRVAPDDSQLAYDRRVLQLVRDNPSVFERISGLQFNQMQKRLYGEAAREQFHELYRSFMDVKAEKIRKAARISIAA